jgi:hypothetical protein
MTLSPLHRNIRASKQKKGCPIASSSDLGVAAPTTEKLVYPVRGPFLPSSRCGQADTGIIKPAMRLVSSYIALVKLSKIRSCYLGAASPLAQTFWHEVN